MMFMWPFVWAAFLVLWGCFDGMESSGEESNVMDDQYSPLIVKKAKALVEVGRIFVCLTPISRLGHLQSLLIRKVRRLWMT